MTGQPTVLPFKKKDFFSDSFVCITVWTCYERVWQCEHCTCFYDLQKLCVVCVANNNPVTVVTVQVTYNTAGNRCTGLKHFFKKFNGKLRLVNSVFLQMYSLVQSSKVYDNLFPLVPVRKVSTMCSFLRLLLSWTALKYIWNCAPSHSLYVQCGDKIT